jgi:hypothetical protein
MKRILLAGIVGGVILFFWLYFAHDVLDLGEIGIKELPNETPVVNAMQSAISASGFYYFPGMGLGPNPTAAEKKAAMPEYMKKYEQVPHGMLIYHSQPGPFGFGAALGKQGALNVLEALLAAFLLSCAAAGRSYWARVGFVSILGILVSLATNVEYFIWYEFPSNYTAGYMTTQILGFALAGLAIAAFVKGGASGKIPAVAA